MLSLLLGAAPGSVPASPASAEDQQNRPSGLTENVTVSLVLVEAAVIDSRGRHVRALQRESFTVREDGQVMPLATFDEVDLARPARAPKAASEAPRNGSGAQPPTTLPTAVETQSPLAQEERERQFVFLFDGYNNTSALRLAQARKAAKKFVRTRMRQGDRAAVYEVSPYLRGISFFTTSAASLDRSIDEVRFFPGESLSGQILDSAMSQNQIGSRTEIQNRILSSAGFALTQQAAERRQFYDSLASLAAALDSVPGRKIVVLFSGGFPILPSKEGLANGGFTVEFKQMIQKLGQARVTVYSLDIGEERALGDVTQALNYRVALDTLGFGSDFLDRMGLGLGSDTSTAFTQILAVLATESGGRLLGGHDYDTALASMDDDTDHFYLLGYVPPEAATAGSSAVVRRERYRSIDVSVNRKGVRVLVRRGRFEGSLRGPQRQQEVADLQRNAPAIKSSSTPTTGPGPVRDHILSCLPTAFPGPNGRTLVTLPLLLKGPISPVKMPEGGFALDITARVVASAGGEEVFRREHSLRVSATAQGAEAMSRGVRLTEAAELAPGQFDLKVNVRLNGLDVNAAWSGSVQVPAFAKDRFEISELSLLGETSAESPLVADVFTATGSDSGNGDRPMEDPFSLDNGWRPVGVAQSMLTPSFPLSVFFRVYRPTVDPATSVPRQLSIDYVLAPAAGGPEILPPARTVYFRKAKATEAFDVIARIDLSGVEPGAYDLRVEAKDGPSGVEVRRGRQIAVAETSSNGADSSQIGLLSEECKRTELADLKRLPPQPPSEGGRVQGTLRRGSPVDPFPTVPSGGDEHGRACSESDLRRGTGLAFPAIHNKLILEERKRKSREAEPRPGG